MKSNNGTKNKTISMANIINNGISEIHNTKCSLTRIWRLIILKSGISDKLWLTYVDEWDSRIKRLNPDKEFTSDKGNATRSLAKPRISWTTFMKGISILKYPKIKITIELFRDEQMKTKPLEIAFELNVYQEDLNDDDDNKGY